MRANDIYGLPTTLEVNGVEHPIRYQYTAVLDIIRALNDRELSDSEKAYVFLFILYEDFEDMEPEDYEEAFRAAQEFLDNGMESDRRDNVKKVDFEQDARLLFPAINRVAGREVRLDPDIHWWTFLGWFMEIGECTYSQVLNIRTKKAEGKQLEKWEQEFYSKNRKLVDIQVKLTEEEKRMDLENRTYDHRTGCTPACGVERSGI